MTTAYITHNHCDKHDMGEAHPESPQRLGAIRDRLIAGQLLDYLRCVEALPATQAQLKAVHDSAYVDSIFAKAPEQGHIEIEADTLLMPHSLAAAVHAAGAVVQAVDLVMSGKMDNAFCAVRPPGHHAEIDRAMGFCFFNNIAVGAKHALTHGGVKRVAIIDFDVHHGNGTEAIFNGDPNVLYASSYQHPFFPYADPGASHDNIMHMPLDAGSGGQEFRTAMTDVLFPRLASFRPELIMISAGFDAHKSDPMGQLRLEDSDFQWITEQLVTMAEQYCQGRIVSVLEGGYHLDALGRCAFSHIRSLMKM